MALTFSICAANLKKKKNAQTMARGHCACRATVSITQNGTKKPRYHCGSFNTLLAVWAIFICSVYNRMDKLQTNINSRAHVLDVNTIYLNSLYCVEVTTSYRCQTIQSRM